VFCRQVLPASDDAAQQYAATQRAPAGRGGGAPKGRRRAGKCRAARMGGADGKSCGKDNVRVRTPVFRRPALLLQRITSAPGVTSGNKTARPIRHVRRPG